MAEQPGGEKTLPPSPRKRQRAREEGHVPKSQDLSAAVLLLVAMFGLQWLAPGMCRGLLADAQHYFAGAHDIMLGPESTRAFTIDLFLRLGRALGPIMVVLLLAGVAVNAAQVGFLLAPKTLALKLDRLNPISGFGRFFSMRTGVELVKSVLKLGLAVWVVYLAVDDRLPDLMMLMHMTPLGIVKALGALVFTVWWRLALLMLVLGILDYGFQRWQYEQELMMTQREAREEAKEMEGDPRIKQRIRQIQRQMATQRMMKQVPQADVVVTNPTTYAVALRYDPASMQAPVVVAKGMRLVAERIRNIATEHDVPIVERPELARALYRTIDIGRPVPEDLFRAVAEVLAFVYRIDRRAEKIRERTKMNATPRRKAV